MECVQRGMIKEEQDSGVHDDDKGGATDGRRGGSYVYLITVAGVCREPSNFDDSTDAGETESAVRAIKRLQQGGVETSKNNN